MKEKRRRKIGGKTSIFCRCWTSNHKQLRESKQTACSEGRGTGIRGAKNEPFWFAGAAFVLVYVYVYRRTNIAFIGRVELRARVLVCLSPISLLLVLALRIRTR